MQPERYALNCFEQDCNFTTPQGLVKKSMESFFDFGVPAKKGKMPSAQIWCGSSKSLDGSALADAELEDSLFAEKESRFRFIT